MNFRRGQPESLRLPVTPVSFPGTEIKPKPESRSKYLRDAFKKRGKSLTSCNYESESLNHKFPLILPVISQYFLHVPLLVCIDCQSTNDARCLFAVFLSVPKKLLLISYLMMMSASFTLCLSMHTLKNTTSIEYLFGGGAWVHDKHSKVNYWYLI